MCKTTIERQALILLSCIAVFFLSVASAAPGVRTPSSAGSVAAFDEPVFRIPRTDLPPAIDGVMEDGEWENASALSAFWYDYANGKFYFLAPLQTQLQVYAMYDDKHLYVAYRSPVYPAGSWLRTRGRYPNVVSHPLYGVLRDDHIELEMRPFHDIARGFQMGLFKWLFNPIDTVADLYWSPRHGMRYSWDSGVVARSSVTEDYWTIEMAIPHEALIWELYDGTDADGNEIVTVPPPDGTVYRCWFARGISGNGPFFNAFDAHVWNTTKTRMIFDSRAIGFQINELGPILDDIIDVHLTVKNHSDRSESVRLGFFVENADGIIYTSYEDEVLAGGVLELIPGEVRRLRLRRPFPGITERGNVLWFDVRTAGTPAKPVFMTRLIDFHAHDKPNWKGTDRSFHEARVDIIGGLRPPRMDFDLRFDVCPYNRRLAAVVDRGIHGASDAAQTAVEMRISVLDTQTDEEIAGGTGPFYDDFAIVKVDLPEGMRPYHAYELSVLLFDGDRRIVGSAADEFNKWGFPWESPWMVSLPDNPPEGQILTPVEDWLDNELGLDDVVWEPYTALEVTGSGFRGLKHEFEIEDSGLPGRIFIRPSGRVLPLELRREGADICEELLVGLGRGPLLRAPMRLEAVVDGVRRDSEVIEPASLARQWDSELEYRSKLRIGPIEAEMTVRYDCDGSMHVTMDYFIVEERTVERFELVTDVRGPVDMVTGGRGGGHMTGAEVWECSLPDYEGIVWDITTQERRDFAPNYFVPWFNFGSADRALSWFADSDRGWGLDRDGSSMTLRRDSEGEVTWHVKFINHPFRAGARRRIEFTILVHPARPKPEGYRKTAWYYKGDNWAIGYLSEPVDLSENYLIADWRRAASAPPHIPYEEATQWRNDSPPPSWNRYGRPGQARIAPDLDLVFEQRASYLLERHIRVGRRVGYWWDLYWPGGFGRTDDLAWGYSAYRRDPGDINRGELPWREGLTTGNMRNMQKRMARIFRTNNVPQRQFHWANAQSNMLESVGWDAQLIEGCGSEHRTFDVDILTQYPMSLYRFMTHPFTGLVVRLVPGPPDPVATAGDDRRLCRQWLGISMMHDIGFSPTGKGQIQHVEQALRVIDILDGFGYFDENATEFTPYWRGQHIVRWGRGRRRYAPLPQLNVAEPDEQLYVSAYRRYVEVDGRSGVEVLFVLLNGFREDVTADLNVLKPELVFGGPNTLMRSDVLGDYRAEFAGLGGLLEEWTARNGGDVPVLTDLEDGSIVELISSAQGETYGNIHVPKHNFRLLYGRSVRQ